MQLVQLPRLGQTMEQGGITAWLVAEGAPVIEGEPLYEVETDKSVTEVEALLNGVLARILVPAGDTVDVGTGLAVVAAHDEEYDAVTIDAFLGGGPDAAPDDAPAAAPAAVPAPAAAAAPAPAGRVLAVPKARLVAKTRGIDLAQVPGSGENGTVRVVDVLKESKARKKAESATRDAVPVQAPAPAPAPFVLPTGAPEISVRIPVRGVARAMADTMTRSWTEIPQFVQQLTVDATALKARLARVRYEGVPATYTDLLICAVAATCVEVPEVNASYAGDEIVRYADVNVSVAVATDRGLLVPVVRRAQQLDLAEVAATTKGLAEHARDGKLTGDDLTGGTITVSNLGAFGIDTGTPIINPPQSALVFVGTMTDQPVAENGVVVIRPRLNVAIAFDHRVLDGMTAARFSAALRTRLEAGG